ncbi:MAG: methionine aminopeptidase [Candidatus Peregrinibacteria bacterium Greene0416_19]|nr:MAG: methionine aminopeptidase [Candidatus Peregrinibacteria bacterium Greene0416_19]
MSHFQTFTAKEIESLRRAGKVLRECLRLVSTKVEPGVTTKQLDEFAEEFIRSFDGAAPAFKGYNNYPATLCTSINDECVHGLPSPQRVLRQGDIVALDCGVIVDGLYTDACVTAGVGLLPEPVQTFVRVTEDALEKACAIVREGVRIGDISSMIQKAVEGAGYACVRALTGHGLGSTLHQFPDIPNVGKKGKGPSVPAYTIIAIEPITSMGSDVIRESEDGWTILTSDGSLSAHFEHTVLVLPDGGEILA